jgi:hypothetical protein
MIHFPMSGTLSPESLRVKSQRGLQRMKDWMSSRDSNPLPVLADRDREVFRIGFTSFVQMAQVTATSETDALRGRRWSQRAARSSSPGSRPWPPTLQASSTSAPARRRRSASASTRSTGGSHGNLRMIRSVFVGDSGLPFLAHSSSEVAGRRGHGPRILVRCFGCWCCRMPKHRTVVRAFKAGRPGAGLANRSAGREGPPGEAVDLGEMAVGRQQGCICLHGLCR